MSDTQNITLSLPRALLKRVKRLAADRDTSVSALMHAALASLADEDRRYSAWKVFAPSADDVLAAIAIQQQSNLSFWDAVVVRAAAETPCDVLWTEDLDDGQSIRGVRVRNPVIGS